MAPGQPPFFSISRLCELSQRPLSLSTHLSCFAISVVLSGVQERDLVTAIQQPSFSFSRLCEHDKLPKSELFSFLETSVEMVVEMVVEIVDAIEIVDVEMDSCVSFPSDYEIMTKWDFLFSAVDVEMGIVADDVDAEMVVSEMVVVVVSEMVVEAAV